MLQLRNHTKLSEKQIFCYSGFTKKSNIFHEDQRGINPLKSAYRGLVFLITSWREINKEKSWKCQTLAADSNKAVASHQSVSHRLTARRANPVEESTQSFFTNLFLTCHFPPAWSFAGEKAKSWELLLRGAANVKFMHEKRLNLKKQQMF